MKKSINFTLRDESHYQPLILMNHSIPVLTILFFTFYATPSWVRKAGAKGTIVDTTKVFRTTTWVPDWDDPVFLEKLDHFHKAFAARYDGQPWVRYVNIGSIGNWGKGILVIPLTSPNFCRGKSQYGSLSEK